MRPYLLATLLVCLTPALARAGDHTAAPAGVDADAALAAMKEGNARFVAGESTFPHLGEARRCETTEGGQHPNASILSCADSRVPPELVFDAGLGDLFVIRVAGNVAGTDEIGTLEYGAAHLGTRLIVVMGHSKCGAVTAVVKHADVGPNIARLVAPIAPAVDEARTANPTAGEQRLVNLAIRANVRRSMHDLLEQSAEIRGLLSSGKVKLVGALYDIHNGTVEWIGEHPDQAALLKTEGEATAAAHDDGHGAHLAAAKLSAAHDDDDGHAAKPTHAERPKAAAAPDGDHGHAAKPAHAESPKPAAAHAAPEAPAKPAHDEPEPAKASAHGDPHAKPAATAHDDHAPAAHAEEPHAAVGPTLMQRQGLLLPIAFMAAGSALSGTLVYAMTGRSKAAAANAAAPTTAPVKPAAH